MVSYPLFLNSSPSMAPKFGPVSPSRGFSSAIPFVKAAVAAAAAVVAAAAVAVPVMVAAAVVDSSVALVLLPAAASFAVDEPVEFCDVEEPVALFVAGELVAFFALEAPVGFFAAGESAALFVVVEPAALFAAVLPAKVPPVFALTTGTDSSAFPGSSVLRPRLKPARRDRSTSMPQSSTE